MFSTPATFRTALEVYEAMCRPVCRQFQLQQKELDVLIFLGSHPQLDTAMDIHRCAGIKSSMLSHVIEKLVCRHFVQRQPVAGDRRKVRLICTEQAEAVIAAGQKIQQEFAAMIFQGATAQEMQVLHHLQDLVAANLQAYQTGS